MALCVALAGAGLACGHGPYGVTFVGTDTEGNLVAIGNWSQIGDYERHQSSDGGHTWQLITQTHSRSAAFSGVSVGLSQATTPRGIYRVIPSEDTGNGYGLKDVNASIVRTVDGRSETVFSVAQLLDNGNILLQQRTRWGAETDLYGLQYDSDSGNIIAAMGTQGVVVVAPDGRWARVGVGRFVPTDFSAAARTRLLLSSPLFWASTLAVSILATATAVVLAVVSGRDIGGAIILVGGVVVAAYAFYLASGLMPLGAIMQLVLTMAVLAITAITLLFILEAAGYRRESLALAFVGLVLAGAMFVYPGFPGFSLLALLSYPPILLIVALPVAFLVAVVINPYLPKGREWFYVGASAGLMTIVSVVPVVLWLQYIVGYETAKLASFGLVAVLAIGLFIRLKFLRRIRAN